MFVYFLLRSYWHMWNADLTPREGRNSKLNSSRAGSLFLASFFSPALAGSRFFVAFGRDILLKQVSLLAGYTCTCTQVFLPLQMWITYFFLLWEHAVNYWLHGNLIAPILTKCISRLTVFSPFPLFDQWYFTSLRQSRNEKITEIKAGALSWCFFTRLLPARWLCSLIYTSIFIEDICIVMLRLFCNRVQLKN